MTSNLAPDNDEAMMTLNQLKVASIIAMLAVGGWEATVVQANALSPEVYRQASLTSDRGSVLAVVVLAPNGCDYFIAESKRGYMLLQHWKGDEPEIGDYISGDFHSYGFKDAYNISQKEEFRVYVDNYMLSKSSVIEEYQEECED